MVVAIRRDAAAHKRAEGFALAMKDQRDRSPGLPPVTQNKRRIDTQIHRRRTVGVHSPLEADWDILQGEPPGRLRPAPLPQDPPDRPQRSQEDGVEPES